MFTVCGWPSVGLRSVLVGCPSVCAESACPAHSSPSVMGKNQKDQFSDPNWWIIQNDLNFPTFSPDRSYPDLDLSLPLSPHLLSQFRASDTGTARSIRRICAQPGPSAGLFRRCPRCSPRTAWPPNPNFQGSHNPRKGWWWPNEEGEGEDVVGRGTRRRRSRSRRRPWSWPDCGRTVRRGRRRGDWSAGAGVQQGSEAKRHWHHQSGIIN